MKKIQFHISKSNGPRYNNIYNLITSFYLMINIQEKKEKILNFLEENGPSLPVRLSKAIEMDPVFVSAIASDLLKSNEVITSHLKVGASSLYMIPGQEEQLVNFSDNLKKLERDAFEKLKENKILVDEDCEPAIRVALRNIKDFAKPFKSENKILWRYAFAKEEIIENKLNSKEEISEPQDKDNEYEEEIFEKIEKISEIQSEEEIFGEKTNEPEIVPKAWIDKKEEIKEAREESQSKIEDIFSSENETPEPEFLKEVKKFLENKKIEFLEEIRNEKKEIVGIVKINSQLGDVKMLLIAKDKKTTSKDEIRSSIQMSTKSNMSCLLIIRKEPSKIIKNILEESHLIKLEVME